MITLHGKATQEGIRQRSLKKHCRLGRATELVFVLATGVSLVIGGGAMAQSTLDWNAGGVVDTAPAVGGNGVWEEGGGTLLFLDDTDTSVDFTSGDNAVFGGPGPYTVSINNGLVTANNVTVNANGITIDGTNNLTVTNVFEVTTGTTTLDASVTGNLTTEASGAGSELIINGTIAGNLTNNAGSGTVIFDDGFVTGITTINGGTVQVNETSADAAAELQGTVTVNNGGSLVVTSGSTNTVVNEGTTGTNVTVDGGTIATLDNNAGNATISSGTVTDLDIDGGEVTVSGTGTVTNNANVAGMGILDFNGGTLTNGVTIDGGTLEVSTEVGVGTITFNTGTLTVDGADLTGTDIGNGANGNITINSMLGATQTVRVRDGQIGAVTINSGAEMNTELRIDDEVGNSIESLTLAGTADDAFAVIEGGTVTGNVQVAAGLVRLGSTDPMNTGPTVNGAMNQVTGGVVNFDNGTLTNGITIDGGTLRFGGGTPNTITLTSGTLDVDGGTTTQDFTIIADQRLIVRDRPDSDITPSDGSVGVVTVNDASDPGDVEFELQEGGSAAGLINTAGETEITDGFVDGNVDVAGGTVTIDESDTNANAREVTGTTTITGGQVILTEGQLNAVTITDGTDGTNEFVMEDDGSIGALTVNDVDGDAAAQLNGGTVRDATNVTSGSVTNDGAQMAGVTVGAGGTFTQNSGSAGGVGNAGTTTLNGGTFGSLTNAGGTSTLNGGSVTNTVAVNGGTVNANGSGVGGATTVAAGGTLNINGSTLAGVTNNGGMIDLNTGTVNALTNNTGMSTLDGGNITTTLAVNGGTVDANGTTVGGATTVNGGTLNINGSTLAGVTNDGGAVNLNTGTVNALTNTTGTSTLAGGNITTTMTVDGGTVDANGTSVGGATNVNGGTLNIGGSTLAGVTNDGGTVNLNTGTVNALTNTAGTSTLAGGNITTTITVDGGTVNANGTTVGGNSTVNGGTLNVNNGTLAGLINSGGTINLSGGTATSLTNNESAGVSTVTNGQVTGTTTINGGTVVVNGANDGTGELQGTTTIANGGVLTLTDGNVGDVVNNGTTDVEPNFTFTDGTVASLDNNSGEAELNGGTLSGTLTVDGGEVTLGGTTVAGDTTVNEGTLDINSGMLAGVTNSANGIVEMSGGTLSGAFSNEGNFDFSGGTISGALSNSASGDIDVDGNATVGGTIENFGSFDINSGTLTGGLLDNRAGSFTFEMVGGTQQITAFSGGAAIADGATFDGNITNRTGRVFNLRGAAGGNFTNNGLLSVRGSNASIDGAFTQGADGVLDLQDNATGTQLTFSGGDTDTFDGAVLLDVDLNQTETGESDLVVFGGPATGNIQLFVEEIDPNSGDEGRANLFEFTGPNGFDDNDLSFSIAFTDEGGQSFSLLTPVLIENEIGGRNFLSLEGSIGVAGDLAAGISLTQTAVGTVVNRPTSPYVVDLAINDEARPCGYGGWTRVTGGQAEIDGGFTDLSTNLDRDVALDLDFGGLQLGGDFACFDDRYAGFDLAFGAIGGYNFGTSSSDNFQVDPVTGASTGTLLSRTSTDFQQSYGGVYLTASRGSFFADVQYRYEVVEFESDNVEVNPGSGQGIAIQGNPYDSIAHNVSGSLGYSWQPFPSIQGLNFVGSTGFSYTQTDTDTIQVDATNRPVGSPLLGSITLDDGEQAVGFLSGTLARGKVLPDQQSFLSYFGTATVYSDFASARGGTLVSVTNRALATAGTGGTRTTRLTVDNLGTYGELSAGLNFVRVLGAGRAGKARQLNAGARLDARFGESLESWGLTGQLRLQF